VAAKRKWHELRQNRKGIGKKTEPERKGNEGPSKKITGWSKAGKEAMGQKRGKEARSGGVIGHRGSGLKKTIKQHCIQWGEGNEPLKRIMGIVPKEKNITRENIGIQQMATLGEMGGEK